LSRVCRYTLAAQQGDKSGLFSLGTCYLQGTGVPVDQKEAARLFRSAADQGLAEAQYWLGVCYNSGTGVELSKAEAQSWFQLAALQGHEQAKAELALLSPLVSPRAETERTEHTKLNFLF
jgi:TPR repeat protein